MDILKLLGLRQKDLGRVVTLQGLAKVFAGTWNSRKFLETYEKSLYVYACVSKISEKVGSTDIKLFQIINSRGDTKELLMHPALDLIYRVNPFQTKAEFLAITVINKLLTGNAFWYKVRNQKGQVVELWNLRPDLVTVVSDPTNFIKQYEFQKEGGEKVIFMPDEIVQHKYPSPLTDLLGTSPLKAAAVRVDTETFASEYQRDFFLNNSRPDAVLTTDDALTEDQKNEARDAWDKKHRGRGNGSKISFLEGGLKYQQISISQREMDYIESMKFTRDDILVAFKTPKAVVAITDDVNRANAETAMFIFLSETIKPEVKSLLEKANELLLIPDFGDNLFYDFNDPTPEDREFRLKEDTELLSATVKLQNEVRTERGLPPVTGGWSYYRPLTDIAVGGLPQNGQPKFIAPDTARQKFVIQNDQRRLFVGRPLLYKRLELQEKLTKTLTDEVMAKLGPAIRKLNAKRIETKVAPAEKKKDNLVPLFKDAEKRMQHYEAINKKIDLQAVNKLKPEVIAQARKQKDKVLDKVKAGHKDLLSKKINLSTLLTGEDDKVMATFILPYLEQFAKDAGLEALQQLAPGETFDISAAVRRNLEDRAKFFAETTNTTTLDKLTETLAEGINAGEGIAELSDRVQNVYNEFEDYRAERIARTETTAANNEGTIDGYKQSGVATHKEWIATLDGRTRDSHVDLNGEIVPVESEFSNALSYPGDESGDPGETINCRCVLGPVYQEQ